MVVILKKDATREEFLAMLAKFDIPHAPRKDHTLPRSRC